MAIWSEAENSDGALGQPWFGRALSEVELEAQPFNASLPGSTAAGRLCVSVHPLLKAHVGTHPDLILRWNAMVAPGTIDVVVHLHGFNVRAQSMRLDKDVEPICGLDFHNPSAPAEPGRTRPTLAVLPRGNWAGGRPGWRHDAYTFPALGEAGALRRLTDDALARFAAATGVQARRGRLIVTAHSGGGNCLLEMLAHIDPDEVHMFDGLYRDSDQPDRVDALPDRSRAWPLGVTGGHVSRRVAGPVPPGNEQFALRQRRPACPAQGTIWPGRPRHGQAISGGSNAGGTL